MENMHEGGVVFGRLIRAVLMRYFNVLDDSYLSAM